MSKKINTINVVEESNYDTISIHAFEDSPSGLAEAQKLFVKIAKEQDGYFSNSEIKEGLKTGFLINETATWNLDLVYSV